MEKCKSLETPLQFAKFAVVGLVSNLTLYILYLFLTYFDVPPKYAMSFLYALGVLQTFIFNRKWTFTYSKTESSVKSRYVCAYLSGYLMNLCILFFMVDKLGYPHQIVQGFTIIFLACMLFLLQKLWVFR